MLGGLGRGAATGAAYAGLAVIALLLSDVGSADLEDGPAIVGVLLYIAFIAGTVGGVCGALAGVLGGTLLWWAAELGCRRGALVAVGCLTGTVLGAFSLDLASSIGTAPDDESALEIALWRIGPAVAGALGATWQAIRMPLRPAVEARHHVG